jgi:hypothetical protein
MFLPRILARHGRPARVLGPRARGLTGRPRGFGADVSERSGEHLQVSHEWDFNGTPVMPGTGVTIEGSESSWSFQRHAKNTKTGTEWIDLLEVRDSGSLRFRSVQPDLVQLASTFGSATSSLQPSAGDLPAA